MAWDIRSGAWRESDLAIIEHAVRPGEVAIDIGANYGLYCYHLGRATGPTGRVLAFEPIPTTAKTLVAVLRLLRVGNVTVFDKGCSDVAGMASFDIPLQPSGAPAAGLARMSPRLLPEAGTGADSTASVMSEVVVLDEFLGSPERISLIKCDIEGAELLALRGARGILESTRPVVVCEVTPELMARFGLMPRQLFDFFEGLAYTPFEVRSGALLATSAELFSALNCIFVPSDKMNRLRPLLTSPQ